LVDILINNNFITPKISIVIPSFNQGKYIEQTFCSIIGAGAYGLPLAACAKKMGKISIHLGGATQLLFGIKGKRWEERSEYANLINEYWTYASEEEKPPHGDKVDGTGPYWA
jgi:hypothetical protein